MKKVPSRPQSRHQKSDSVHLERELRTSKSFHIKNLDLSCISLNTFTSNNPHHLDLGSDTHSQKQSKGQSSGKNYENQYHKVCQELRESYLEIKNKVVENDPNCALILKRHVPLDQGDEAIMSIDAITVIQYMNKIFDKLFELKRDAETELLAKKEDECNDYESMLQKLEAEVRQHIRIEQQLKLYVESTQAKLDEFEKTYDPEKIEAIKKENEDLKHENSVLSDKLKKRDSEIESYKKELQNKSSIVKDLEHQTENIPSLKNRIKDLEKFISQNSIKVSSSNVLKFSNRTNKDSENLDKSSSQHHHANDSQTRKTSQPILGSRSSEVSKHRHHDRDKENIETYKLDLSKYMYDNAKVNRSHYEPYKTGDHSRHDTSMTKSSSKREDKLDDFGSVLDKMKKPRRSSHSRNNSKNNRSFDQALNHDDIIEQGLKSVDYKKGKKDIIESAKSTFDKRLSFGGSSIQEVGRRSWDNKSDYKIDSKSLQNKNYHYKEALESESNVKNNIPKPRPSVGHENSYLDFSKHRKDNEYYDLNKLKVASPKKALQDRSQSVDAKQRLAKQLKPREEHIDKHHKEQPRPSVGASHAYTNPYTISRSHHGSVKHGHY